MLINTMTAAVPGTDSELVSRSIAGERNAFGEIVARYQSLICSLAYSATGSLTQSEDLAQETFLAAWKQLAALREPSKLRAWLCGIARNQINNSLRKQGREPSHRAESLDHLNQSSAFQKPPSDEAITKEEETILWRSLESIPLLYRDPLILFYREGQSVERVADSLELSEDAVKQRLSRGRKMLQEQVSAFVEGALARSVPGKAFTMAVLAALPASLTLSAKAASMAATAAKGSSTAKAAAATGLLGALLTPLMAIFGTWVGYRLNLDSAQSDLERQFVKKSYRRTGWLAVALGLPLLVVLICADYLSAINRGLFTGLLISVVVGWLIVFSISALVQWKERRQLLETLKANGLLDTARPGREYLSKARFLGLPLVHYRIGGGVAAQKGAVKAWIAIGDCAIGGLFAFGGFAIAPISIGGIAVGLISFGGCAVGLLSLGGLGVGYWTFGAVGAGWLSFSACAIAWKAASGGVALAHDYALGGFAQAIQANNETARDLILSLTFFRAAYAMLPFLPWMNLLWILPLFKWWRIIKKQTQNSAHSP